MEISSIPDRFSVEKIIGQGNFGVIYRGRDKDTSEKIAIKVIKFKSGINEMQNEIKILSKIQGGEGIPLLKYHSKESGFYVMNLLGNCINDIFLKQNKQLTDSNFVLIAKQLLQRIEYIHSKSILHRDIKPHQLLVDRKKKPKLYLIDFGLSKAFENNNGSHVSYSEGRPFAGTFNYASLNAHLGIQQSRRDDLESYCYVLAYFFNGDLPWRLSLSLQNEASIRKMKISMTGNELFPSSPPLGKIFTYVRSLKFDEQPDYQFIYSFLNDFTQKIPNLLKFISFKQSRTASVFVRTEKLKKTRGKSNTFICKGKDQDGYNDFSTTLVDKNYPEMKRKEKKVISEVPTSESLKVQPENKCIIF